MGVWRNGSATVFKLEPYSGNIISGGDDIGETLTGKADGNTEGMDNIIQPVETR